MNPPRAADRLGRLVRPFSVGEASWVAIAPHYFGIPKFSLAVIIAMIIVMAVTAVETTGDVFGEESEQSALPARHRKRPCGGCPPAGRRPLAPSLPVSRKRPRAPPREVPLGRDRSGCHRGAAARRSSAARHRQRPGDVRNVAVFIRPLSKVVYETTQSSSTSMTPCPHQRRWPGAVTVGCAVMVASFLPDAPPRPDGG